MSKKTFDYAAKYYQPDNACIPATKVRVKKIIKLVGKNNKVLDVGCYDGAIGALLKANQNEVFGIDASAKCVRKARQRGIKAVVGDLEKKFPFKKAQFDLVLAGEILEHILDTEYFLDEIKRVLKPKGELVITTPNTVSLGRRIMFLCGMNAYFEASFGFPRNATAGHVRFFTKKLLWSFLEYMWFEILSFESDVVNFSDYHYSKKLADLWPTLGRGLIFKCRKVR